MNRIRKAVEQQKKAETTRIRKTKGMVEMEELKRIRLTVKIMIRKMAIQMVKRKVEPKPEQTREPKIRNQRKRKQKRKAKTGKMVTIRRWMSQPTTECGVSIFQSSRFWRNASRTKSRTNKEIRRL